MRPWLIAALGGTVACFVPRERDGRPDDSCTRCHGDPARDAGALERSAPPFDVLGNDEPKYPGVGAHLLHLGGTSVSARVPCQACHRVPMSLGDEGHNNGITEVILAGPDARYDARSRTCTQSACHGPRSGTWTRPRPSDEACGSCHGKPPAPPHAQAGTCEVCHPTAVSQHVDGVVQVLEARCDACHGAQDGGAPPRALDGGTSAAQRGVGAHATHLAGGAVSRPVPCQACHPVPERVVTASHPNGGPAEVTLPGWASATGTCLEACHGNRTIAWTAKGPLSCDSCHGAPPPLPHPQVLMCTTCHPEVSAAQRAHHVDGTVQVQLPTTCDACHGSATSAAPPRDLDGGVDPARPGVGAHRSHLTGTGRARPARCEECHPVPDQLRSARHLNGVVEVLFSGAAVANQAPARYSQGRCFNAACHDVSNWAAQPGGGTQVAPRWTVVDGGEVTCGSCHGLPPPLPHPARSDCGTCHSTDPNKHIDGRVDFMP